MNAKKRLPSNRDVGKWVEKIGSESSSSVQGVQQVTPAHWQLGMHNRVGQYTMDIKDQGDCVSYGIPLTPDVEGKNEAAFYRELLGYSAKINGSHIGIEGDKLVLTREEHKEGLNPLALGRSIRLMDDTHQVVYPEVLKMEKRHGLNFRNRKK